MRGGLSVLGVLCAVTLAVGCGGVSRRDRVRGFIASANAIAKRSSFAFAQANADYRAFTRGRLAPAAAAADLARDELAIRSTRAQLAALRPPSEARRLQTALLRVYDANAELASETTRLAVYQPQAARALRPLAGINTRLRSRLRAGVQAPQQVSALASYAHALDGLLGRLRRLSPPPVLLSAHRAQVARLGAVSGLARRLGAALRARNAQAVARLLVAFRSVNAQPLGTSLAGRAVASYDRRYRRIDLDVAAMRRELIRVQRSVG